LAVARASVASETLDCSEVTCCCAELVWLLPPAAALAEAALRLLFALLSCAFAAVSEFAALVTAAVSAVGSRVPITWPAVTVAPSEVVTVAIVPGTAKDAVTSLTGAIEPLAVMVLLTAPCFTVDVSWVAAGEPAAICVFFVL
jgi:hypothetical protein